MPSSQTANAITATEFLGKSRAISGRFDSPLASSFRWVPAIWTEPSLRSARACELLRWGQDEFDARGLKVAGEHRDAGVATGHEEPTAEIGAGVENLNSGLASTGRTARDDRVRRGKVPRHRRWRAGHQPLINPAELNGLPGANAAGTGQQCRLLRAQATARRWLFQGEQLFYRGIESARELQRDRRVRDEGARFRRVDRLAANASGGRQADRGEPALPAELREVGGDLGHVYPVIVYGMSRKRVLSCIDDMS
jgi:hypothetical protein